MAANSVFLSLEEFALNEATYTLARLVQTTDSLESRDPRPWIEGLSMACTSANGAEVAFVL